MSDVRPTAMMRYMEDDEQAVSSLSKASRRVKIETNHTWNIRLLPVEIGQDKMPYVRLAQHWRNSKPTTCPTFTPKAWGGNPDMPCPVCELSERLNESGDDTIRNLGYQARCVLRFRFWCVVFDKEDARGKIEEMPDEELLNPYEFDMYKTTWEDFKKYQKWATTRRKGGGEPSEWGVMDLETGCNLLATHGAKGIRLDRQDPGPIFDAKDPDWDAKIGKIWTRIRKPTIVIPTEKQLLELAIKFEEDAESGGGRRSRSSTSSSRGGYRRDDDRGGDRGGDRDDDRGGRGRSRYSGEDDDNDRPSSRSSRAAVDDEPRSRRSTRDEAPAREERREERSESAPPPRRRIAADDDQPAEKPVTQRDLEEDQIPGAEVPPRRQAEEPPPRRPVEDPAPRRQPPSLEAEGVTPPRRQSVEAPQTSSRRQAPQEDAPPPPPRRQAPAPQESEAPPPPSRRQAEGSVDEEDNVPEERRDPAPPVKERVEEPAPGEAAAPPPTRNSDLKARLDKITKKGQ